MVTKILSWVLAFAEVTSEVAFAVIGILLVVMLVIYIKKMR